MSLDTSKIRPRALGATLLVLTLASGCSSSTPLKTEESSSGIRAAEEVGAADVPQASLHLQLAKEELEAARRLSAKGDTEEGASMLMRAEADAELAVALSREDAEKQAAAAAVESVRKLRQDNQPAIEGSVP